MAPHSSTLAWKIPWVEEPGRLQSMGSLRVGHDWVTLLSLSCIGEGNGNPLQCSCLENPRDGGAWWAAVYGVTQSQTRLMWLSSSSSSQYSKKGIPPSPFRSFKSSCENSGVMDLSMSVCRLSFSFPIFSPMTLTCEYLGPTGKFRIISSSPNP